MSRRKTPLGPLGCLIALLYFPFGVIFELASMYGGTGRYKKRRRRR